MYIQQDNRTALYHASIKGHDKVAKALLAAKATVNTRDKVSFVVCVPSNILLFPTMHSH